MKKISGKKKMKTVCVLCALLRSLFMNYKKKILNRLQAGKFSD